MTLKTENKSSNLTEDPTLNHCVRGIDSESAPQRRNLQNNNTKEVRRGRSGAQMMPLFQLSKPAGEAHR